MLRAQCICPIHPPCTLKVVSQCIGPFYTYLCIQVTSPVHLPLDTCLYIQATSPVYFPFNTYLYLQATSPVHCPFSLTCVSKLQAQCIYPLTLACTSKLRAQCIAPFHLPVHPSYEPSALPLYTYLYLQGTSPVLCPFTLTCTSKLRAPCMCPLRPTCTSKLRAQCICPLPSLHATSSVYLPGSRALLVEAVYSVDDFLYLPVEFSRRLEKERWTPCTLLNSQILTCVFFGPFQVDPLRPRRFIGRLNVRSQDTHLLDEINPGTRSPSHTYLHTYLCASLPSRARSGGIGLQRLRKKRGARLGIPTASHGRTRTGKRAERLALPVPVRV
nr:uncharacterized protein LOC129454509 [Misgurnus anguillicaudatus]